VVTSQEAEEPAAELLTGIFKRPAAAYINARTGTATASVFCHSRAEWDALSEAELRLGLAALKSYGIDIRPGKITFREVPREDWSESWKRHFKPIAIGARLLITPGWIKRAPRRNQAVVILNPGLSFGTGNHATTRFCLREIVRRRKPGARQSFWDVGTGSGILAIAAAKLGYSPVDAIDFDAQAIRVAKQNARMNRVSSRLRISRKDIARVPLRSRKKYDLICANLTMDLLIAQRSRILSRLARGGTLVLAGILLREFEQIERHYRRGGMKLIAGRSDGAWRSGAFTKLIL